MFKFPRIIALLSVSCALAGVARAQNNNTIPRTDFGAILKLPLSEQEPKVSEVYGSLRFFHWLFSLHDGSPAIEYSAIEQNELAIQILRLHPDATASSIHDDLTSTNGDSQASGLRDLELLSSDPPNIVTPRAVKTLALSGVWRDTIYQDLAAIFQTKPDTTITDHTAFMAAFNPMQARKISAASALAQLGNTRALALLIEDDPAYPANYRWDISPLAKLDPTNPALQKLVPLLASPDSEKRSDALIALPVARSEVYRMLPVLLDDPSRGVRYFAVCKTFELPGDQFAPLENQLKTKLADAEENVKLAAAKGFAARKNPIAAPVLLAWLRAHSDEGFTSNVNNALNQLIGFDSGFQPTYTPTPQAEQDNATALARVEAWIASHPAN